MGAKLLLHRPGGTRTPNRRFWRPVLYQLSYGPTHGQGRNRTADTTIFSRVLYQLSYLAFSCPVPRPWPWCGSPTRTPPNVRSRGRGESGDPGSRWLPVQPHLAARSKRSRGFVDPAAADAVGRNWSPG